LKRFMERKVYPERFLDFKCHYFFTKLKRLEE